MFGAATDRGVQAFNEGRYREAAKALESSQDTVGQAFYGLSLAGLNQCGPALPLLLKTPEADRSLYRLTSLAAVKCYSTENRPDRAEEVLAKLETRYPSDPDVLYLAAKLHMKAFNDATLAMFQRAPASYRVHQLSAEIFEIQNRYREAAGEYAKAIEINPRAPDLHFRLGRAILLQGHDPHSLDQAAAEFEAELRLSPEDSACEFQLGQIAMIKGADDEAGRHLDRALALSPDFVQALIARGKLEMKKRDYAGAIQVLNRASAQQPANETVHYTLMTAYRNAGQMDKAREEKALLDKLQKPPEGEFSEFLKKLGEKPAQQQ
jgi:tetratricopeptide (TPR) repeat protein